MSMEPWWKNVEPHEDIVKGELKQSQFAVQLGDAVAGEGQSDYANPVTFFDRTYFTRNLERILLDVLNMVGSDGGRESVIQLLTSFGGGKTHTLLSIYHMFENREKVDHLESIDEIIEKSEVEDIPEANVSVVVGNDLNPVTGREVEDTTIKTIWGEIAYQLGGESAYKIIEENDNQRVAPGKDDLKEVLNEAGPSVILMDELTDYVTKAAGVEGKNLESQTISFLQELTEVVSNMDKVSLVVTLPQSPYERSGEAADELYEEIYEKVKRRVGRVEEAWTPIEEDEIYDVVSKRLFREPESDKEVKKTIDSFTKMYGDLGDKVKNEVQEPEYREKMEKSYPFHPEVIDALYQRWGSLPKFQRTRGVLRLLALVIRQLYDEQPHSSLIQAGDIKFNNDRIQSEVLRYLDDETWRAVISSDIGNIPEKIDSELGGEYKRENLALKLSRAIFLYSHHSGDDRGTNIEELRAAILKPDFSSSEFVTEVVRRFKGTGGLWYLDEDSAGNLFFRTTPSLNKMVIEVEEQIEEEEINEKYKEITLDLSESTQTDIKTYCFPKGSEDIENIEKIQIAYLGTEYGATKDIENTDVAEFVWELIENYRESKRTHKNSLIFAVPDKEDLISIKEDVRKLLALQEIYDSPNRLEKLEEKQRNQVETRLERIKNEVPNTIKSSYRFLVKANDTENLQVIDTGKTNIGGNLTESFLQTLEERGVVLKSLDPSLIEKKLWPEKDETLSIDRIWSSFHNHYGLPIPESKDVLIASIETGVEVGEFGLIRGELGEEKTFYFKEPVNSASISEEWKLIRPQKAEEIIARKKSSEEQESEISEPEKEESEETETGEDEGHKGENKVVQPSDSESENQYTKLSISAGISPHNFTDFYRGVISPLNNEVNSEDIEVKIDVNVDSESGLSESVIKTKIEETLKQIQTENKEIDFS